MMWLSSDIFLFLLSIFLDFILDFYFYFFFIDDEEAYDLQDPFFSSTTILYGSTYKRP